jgi:hypothetical protein
MNRDALARMALTAFPPAERAARGPELLATTLDVMAGASRRHVARELADLTQAGLRVRGVETASAGPARVLGDGLGRAGAWILTLDLATLLAQRVRGEQGALLSSWSIGLLAVVLATVLVGFDRAGGCGALIWTATRTPALLHDIPATDALLAALVPVTCFAVLVAAPRRGAPDVRRLAWLLVPVALAAVLGPPPWEQNGVLVAFVALAALATVAAAIVLLPTDPRLAIAGAVPLSDLGIGVLGHPGAASPVLLAVLATAPATCALAVVRTHRLQRGSRGG